MHISLGIFFRLFTLLEDECHELDVGHSLGLQGSTAGSTFNTFTAALRRQCTLRDNINRLSTQIQALEQLLTLATVTLAPSMPQMTVFNQQLVGVQRQGKVKWYNEHTKSKTNTITYTIQTLGKGDDRVRQDAEEEVQQK